jgi:hypothetical protein
MPFKGTCHSRCTSWVRQEQDPESRVPFPRWGDSINGVEAGMIERGGSLDASSRDHAAVSPVDEPRYLFPTHTTPNWEH